MIIKIIDISPDDSGKTRLYFTMDGGDTTSLLMDNNDLNSLQTVENAVKALLKGKEYIGESFEI